MKTPSYLGDGVYANFDGLQIVLTTLEGDVIYLEHFVFEALKKYAKLAYAEQSAEPTTIGD